MKHRKGRYGIPGKEVDNLCCRWDRTVSKDCDWENVDAFIFWCSVNGYKPGLKLGRINQYQPHGPGNSFWYDQEELEKQRKEQEIAQREGFCQNCAKTCPNRGNGCDEWKQHYVKNWNQNISTSKKLRRNQPSVTHQETCEKFVYEHPDLIREGIIFG